MLAGLLWGFTSNQQGEVTQLSPETRMQPGQTNKLTWLHFQSDLPGTEASLNVLGLREEVVHILCAEETRPRLLSFPEGQVLLLRAINKNDNADPEDMVSLRIWFSEKLVITARKRDRGLRSAHQLKSQYEDGQTSENAGELMLRLIENIAAIISEVVHDLDDTLDQFEEQLADNIKQRSKLTELRQKSASLRRFLAPQRDALEEFYRSGKVLDNGQRSLIRELSDRMTRYIEELDLCRERALVLQEEMRQTLAEQQATRLYVLSLVTAVFLPLSFLTGVFGMNVAGLPGVEEPQGFVYVAGSSDRRVHPTNFIAMITTFAPLLI